MVQYVVDGEKSVGGRPKRKFINVREYTSRRFAPEIHACASQAAKRAMMLGAPPAAARGLDRQAHNLSADQCRQLESVRGFKIVRVIRLRQGIQICNMDSGSDKTDRMTSGTAGDTR